MILALLGGQATPEQIARLARGQAQRQIPQLIEALEGHRMNEHGGSGSAVAALFFPEPATAGAS
jgi:hypothetical protein